MKDEKMEYPGCYRIYCPFSALGDVYYMMAYLPYFLEMRQIRKFVIFTIGASCAEVAGMFGAEHVKALSQSEMDESIQAVRRSSSYTPFDKTRWKALWRWSILQAMRTRCL